MFGSHLSISGSMANALREAERLTFDTVQVFTKNQQQWRVPPLKQEAIDEWKGELKRLGWGCEKSTPRTVAHASYLINLASPNPEQWRMSVDLMFEEVSRCEQLGIPHLVHHPGAHTSGTREDGLARIVEAYVELLARTRGWRTVLCLENTVGGGSTLGREFEELAALRKAIVERVGAAADGSGDGGGSGGRVGFCFDTCHAHAGGNDMSSVDAANHTLDHFERTCGLANLHVLHLNDSKGKLGSRLDRHEHIGQGTIGLEGFRAVVMRPELRGRAMILETPKDRPEVPEGGEEHDAVNLRALRGLLGIDTPTRAPMVGAAAVVVVGKPQRKAAPKANGAVKGKSGAKKAPKVEAKQVSASKSNAKTTRTGTKSATTKKAASTKR